MFFPFWLDSHILCSPGGSRSTANGLITALVISLSSPCPLTSLPFSDGSHQGFEAFDPFFSLSRSLSLPPAKMTPHSLACHRRGPAQGVVVGGGRWLFPFSQCGIFMVKKKNKQTMTPFSTLRLPHFRRLPANNKRHEVTSPR